MPGSVGPATLRKLQRLLAVLVVGAGVTVGSVGAVIFGLGRSDLLGGIIATDVAAAITLGIVLLTRRMRRTRWDAMVSAVGGTVRGGPPAGLHDQAQLIRQSLAAGGVALLLASLDQPLEIAAVSGAVPNGLRPGARLPGRLPAQGSKVARPTGWQLTAAGDPLHLQGAYVTTCALAPVGTSGGLVIAWSTHPSGRALRRLGTIAGSAHQSIERSRLDEAEFRSRLGAMHARRHMSLLVSAGAALARAIDDWQPALDEIASDVVPNHVDYFAVDLIPPDGAPQRLVASHIDGKALDAARDPRRVCSRWNELITDIGDRTAPVVSPTGRDTPAMQNDDADLAEYHRRLGLTSWAVLPVRLSDGTIGVFSVGTVQSRRGLRPSDISAYEELVSRCALAFERITLYREAATREERLRSMVEASPLAIIETAPSGELQAWNPAAAELFEWSPDEPRLDASTRAILDELRARLTRGVRIVAERATIERVGDTTPVTVSIAASLIGAVGADEANLVCMLTDITQQERLEGALQARERMEALGRLAGGVAHDFNNLLTVIVGYSEMLAEGLGTDHPMFADVDAIRSAGRRAAAFTEQLLTISRQRVRDAGKTVDLIACVAAMEPVLRRLIGDDVTLVFDSDGDAGWVQIDQSQLEQVLLNLVVNARDAMPDGGRLTVAVAPTTDDQARTWATLTVTDTGIGMDAATRERCFEPFFTTKGLGKGTGLGLATVYTVVDQASGEVSIDSTPGVGTSITARWPQAAAGEVEAPVEPTARRFAPAGAAILLVEDDDMVRSFASSVLSNAGYTVLEASDATSAIEVAQSGLNPRALITDVVMPGMSGPELAAELPHLPALYISGYVEDERRRRLLEAAPSSRFLAKPFRADELLDALVDVLAESAAQGSNR